MTPRPLVCPYCAFAIDRALLGSGWTIRCPQCARALRVSLRCIATTAVLVEAIVFLVWFWAREIRGISLWGLDLSMAMILGWPAVALISLFLPRELAPRRRQSEYVTTLDLEADDKKDDLPTIS